MNNGRDESEGKKIRSYSAYKEFAKLNSTIHIYYTQITFNFSLPKKYKITEKSLPPFCVKCIYHENYRHFKEKCIVFHLNYFQRKYDDRWFQILCKTECWISASHLTLELYTKQNVRNRQIFAALDTQHLSWTLHEKNDSYTTHSLTRRRRKFTFHCNHWSPNKTCPYASLHLRPR